MKTYTKPEMEILDIKLETMIANSPDDSIELEDQENADPYFDALIRKQTSFWE